MGEPVSTLPIDQDILTRPPSTIVVVLPGIGGSVLLDEGLQTVWGTPRATIKTIVRDPGALDIERPLIPARVVPKTKLMGVTLIPGYSDLMWRIATTLWNLGHQNITAGSRNPEHQHQQPNRQLHFEEAT